MAKAARVFLTLTAFFLFVGAGCKAQTSSAAPGLPAEVVRRIQTEIRTRYQVPARIDISVSAPKPAVVPGYDGIVVTLTGGTQSPTFDFLISKDRKKLARLETFDISEDLMSKIDVKGRPVRGNPSAKVTVVNYDDFECPFCSRMHATLFPELLKVYGDRVKIIYKDYPLVEIHPWAMHAAVDANCLADQNNDAYWEFADYLHANQRVVSGKSPAEAFANLDKATTDEGDKHHLDQQKLAACVKKQDETAVRASMAEGDKLGVDSTPTMFIDGERYSGVLPDDQLHTILNRALVANGQQAPSSSAKK